MPVSPPPDAPRSTTDHLFADCPLIPAERVGVIGRVTKDKVTRLESLLELWTRDRTQVQSQTSRFGGGATHLPLALKRLGLTAVPLVAVPQDLVGDGWVRGMEKLGIATRTCTRYAGHVPINEVLEDDDGQRRILLDPVRQAPPPLRCYNLSPIGTLESVLFADHLAEEVLRRGVELAEAAGVTASWLPAQVHAGLLGELGPKIHIVQIDCNDAEVFLGLDPNDDPYDLANALRDLTGARYAVVTTPAGCFGARDGSPCTGQAPRFNPKAPLAGWRTAYLAFIDYVLRHEPWNLCQALEVASEGVAGRPLQGGR